MVAIGVAAVVPAAVPVTVVGAVMVVVGVHAQCDITLCLCMHQTR